MHLLVSGPSEILVQIIQSCDDFLELVALISTCKRLHAIWTANTGNIIWHVGRRDIIAFDDALMAVRATDIVKTAHQSGKLPPCPFPMEQLRGAIRKPNLQELQHVFNLQHMMRCVECMLLRWKKRPPTDFFYSPKLIRATYSAIGWEAWKGNFYRSMYRVVLAGAIFSRAYNEPFYLAARDGRTEFSERWGHRRTLREVLLSIVPQIDDGDVECLRRFPVYNYDAHDESETGRWRDREYESVFGPFAEWIVQDGMTRGEKRSTGQDFESAQNNAIDDVMRLVAAYEHLSNKIVNGVRKRHLGRKFVEESERKIQGNVRKVSVVLFGVFQVEEITMPALVEDAANVYLIANPDIGGDERKEEQKNTGPSTISPPLNFVDIAQVLLRLSEISRGPNHHDGFPAPPSILQFFVYTFRKHFGLRFSKLAFENREDRPYLSLAKPEIFSDGQSVRGVLQTYHPPILSYQR